MKKILDILQGFEPISLKEMDEVKLLNRTDTKYIFSTDKLAQILEMVKDDYRTLEIEGNRVSSYRSLYYDTPDLYFYHAHHNGRVDRHKVRFRKYIESGLCFLEVKHKYKGRTDKRRTTRDDFELDLTDNSYEFLKSEKELLESLEPSLWNSFHRITLVNKSAAERMTIDLGLTFEWEGWNHTEDQLVIAEVKQERVDRSSPFMVAARKLGLRPMRISKYCIGMVMKDEKLKYNNFKPKLRAIQKIRNESN